MKPQSAHRDHRKRLRNRFRAEGLGNFEKHNILELLTFYSVPRRDTNELGHALMNRFGSLSAVFEASEQELLEVEGVGENTALLIRLVHEIWLQYMQDKNAKRLTFSDREGLRDYLKNLYLGKTEETVYCLYFNAKEELICAQKIFGGSVQSCVFRKRQIVEAGIRVSASFFILVHNHPAGNPDFSEQDVRTTQSLARLFRELEMPMADHYVVSGENVTSFRESQDTSDPA